MYYNIPVYLINLYNRPERLISSIKELKKINLSKTIKRIEACTPNEAIVNQGEYLTKKAYNNIKNTYSTIILPNYKSLACGISHIETWREIMKSQENEAFIVEDDIIINDSELCKIELNRMNTLIRNISRQEKKLKPIFITFNSNINTNTNIILNETYYYDNINPSDHNGIYFKKITDKFIGLHFYYINRPMIKYLLEQFYIYRLTYQIDIQFYTYISNFNFHNSHIYNLSTNSIIQSKKFISDIQWFNYRPNSLSIVLKLPIDISENIYKFITNFTKRNNEILFNNVY